MAKKCYAYDTKLKKKVPVPCKETEASAERVSGSLGGMAGKAAEALKRRKKKMTQYMP